jgi:hypothetical protein
MIGHRLMRKASHVAKGPWLKDGKSYCYCFSEEIFDWGHEPVSTVRRRSTRERLGDWDLSEIALEGFDGGAGADVDDGPPHIGFRQDRTLQQR